MQLLAVGISLSGAARKLLFAGALILLACSPAAGGKATPAAAGPSNDAGPAAAGYFPGFALGIEYMELGLAEAYGPAGVGWAKTRLEAFSWGRSEPAPPVAGVHRYDWSLTDSLMREYQVAGFAGIQSYLQPKSAWGSTAFNDIMPRPEFMDDYRAWVTALIERYDRDGTEDMPGLVAPVQYWVAGGEWTGFWPSKDVDDYLAFLGATAEAAHAAWPDVKVGAIPFLLSDVFEGNEPSAAQIAARLKDPPPAWRNSTAGMYAILDHPELFDYVNLHSLGSYTEIPPMLRWLRAQMAARGYDRPIWIDDAFPMSWLAVFHPGPNIGLPPAYPVSEETYQTVYDLLIAIARGDEPASPEARAWVEKMAAIGTVQKAVTALAEGAVGINVGNLEDWIPDTGEALRVGTVNLIGAAGVMGMLDVSHPRGYGVDRPRTPGQTRPAFHSLQEVAGRIGDGKFDRIEAIGGLAGPRGYRLERNSSVIWVLWNEAGLVLPGEPEPSAEFEIEVPEGWDSVRVTPVVTVRGVTEPPATTISVAGGRVSIALTDVPVFIDRTTPRLSRRAVVAGAARD